ncbi:hypothetical protein GQ457_01G053650 [Hibiscus cannabinus]
MSIVLKIWKRLVVTFFSMFVVLFFYLVVIVVIVLIWVNFNEANTNCMSYSVSYFSDFIHRRVLVFDHHPTLDNHYICFRSICVSNHDEEQELDQIQCRFVISIFPILHLEMGVNQTAI